MAQSLFLLSSYRYGSRTNVFWMAWLLYWSPVQIFCYHRISSLRQNLYIESMLYALTQPERELLSNRYGTRTKQHMHDQTTSVQLSHSSPRYT